jgi:hypothetical protein
MRRRSSSSAVWDARKVKGRMAVSSAAVLAFAGAAASGVGRRLTAPPAREMARNTAAELARNLRRVDGRDIADMVILQNRK